MFSASIPAISIYYINYVYFFKQDTSPNNFIINYLWQEYLSTKKKYFYVSC